MHYLVQFFIKFFLNLFFLSRFDFNGVTKGRFNQFTYKINFKILFHTIFDADGSTNQFINT